jgi:hypothetical protein
MFITATLSTAIVPEGQEIKMKSSSRTAVPSRGQRRGSGLQQRPPGDSLAQVGWCR